MNKKGTDWLMTLIVIVVALIFGLVIYLAIFGGQLKQGGISLSSCEITSGGRCVAASVDCAANEKLFPAKCIDSKQKCCAPISSK